MKITVAIDSFKGSLTSSEAENTEQVLRIIKAVKDYTQEKNKKRGILL